MVIYISIHDNMKTLEALDILGRYDREGHTVWSLSDLRVVFPEAPETFRKTLGRLCANRILTRVSRGVYVFGRTVRDRRAVFGELIGALRAGEYCFESLDSAASEWGIVSQTPLGGLTVMTTGRSGSFETPYGPVEFVHTDASVNEILANTIPRDGFIPLATRDYTVHGLRRCGRIGGLREALAVADGEEGQP